ncbi:MAG: pyridoxamine 5'-phosphate oxidase family protein [Chloroflexi bacterium]|nr:pyridoxamine 5'-phosphate oxidase family protein [Chloroflexota bacterium]
MSPYHAGELAVQARAGVQELARRVGASIHPSIPLAAQEFLRDQPMLVVASLDANGRVWASLLAGPPGFAQPLDERTVLITATPAAGDPLSDNLRTGAQVGLLAIEFATRRRMRLNGMAEVLSDETDGRPGTDLSFRVHAQQVYANCPKYIQAREWTAFPDGRAGGDCAGSGPTVSRSRALTGDQQQWIERADTFFIASAHPEGGADASHRGGRPGFVRVQDDGRLLFPDYAGNTMFNTLGNILASPRAALLFVDFEIGATLQLTGRAEVIWDAEQTVELAGAERLVAFDIDEVIEIVGAYPLRSRLVSYSPFNPA